MKRIRNALCVDLDDLGHAFFETRGLRYKKYCIDYELERLLEHLDELNIKVTFFVPGAFVKKSRKMLLTIKNKGHDIASHGFKHEYINRWTPDKFKNDVLKSKKMIEDIIGNEVDTYKAPIWSMSKDSLWPYDILIEAGFKIDNSAMPKVMKLFNRKESLNHPIIYKDKLLVIPPTTINLLGYNFKIFGGFYNAWLPLFIEKNFFYKLNNLNLPFNYYFHPFEHSPCKFKDRGIKFSFNVFLYSIHFGRYKRKLDLLARYFNFVTLKEAYKEYLIKLKNE